MNSQKLTGSSEANQQLRSSQKLARVERGIPKVAKDVLKHQRLKLKQQLTLIQELGMLFIVSSK